MLEPRRTGPDVILTGATGFTGGRLAERLAEEGRQVVALVRRTSDTSRLDTLGIEQVEYDLADRDSVRKAFREAGPARQVFHLAAAFRRQHADVREFQRVNVEGTRHVADAALEAGVERFIHCSTVGVQGHIDHPPATEDYRPNPGDAYQQSKLEGEQVVHEAAERGLPVTVLRPVGIYGPGDRRFLKLFRLVAHQKMIMIGDGKTLYHLTHVDDVVEGLMTAARVDAALGETFNIAGERYTTLNELVELIARAAGVPPPSKRIPYAPVAAAAWACDRVCRVIGVMPPLYPRRVHFFKKDRAFSTDKAARILGFRARVDLEEGLAISFRWYRDHGLL